VIVKLKEPAWEGVPVNSPVGQSVSPCGSSPLEMVNAVVATPPPLCEIGWL